MTLILKRGNPGKLVLRQTWQPMDPDAATYISAVEAADGQSLELKVKIAIDNFVLGCKADGTWNAIKACCILAGARTLAGCLVPLVGAAPTNFNFVSGDYDRKAGLLGNRASLKYLDTNRNNNSDPQDSRHLSVYASAFDTANSNPPFIACSGSSGSGRSMLNANNSSGNVRLETSLNNSTVTSTTDINLTAPAFIGINRSSSASYTLRRARLNVTITQASTTPVNATVTVFRRVGGTATEYGAHRLSYYSIGESLDLYLLDNRVTDLINAIAAAIP